MSTVKQFLASQRADFISLHDLLEAMTRQGSGCSLEEAAGVLSQVLKNETLSPWVTYTPTKGMEQVIRLRPNPFRPDELLDYVSNHGKYEDDWGEIPF